MKLLDLFCGAGGASVGYHRAGFTVTGVDIEPQPDYPYEFVQDDALDYVKEHGHEYDVIHASPPCQASSALTKGTNRGRTYIDLIPETRAALAGFSCPTIIENVKGADLRKDLLLCGEMFGLRTIRHRFFEIDGITVAQPQHIKHRGRTIGWRHGTYYDGYYYAVYGRGGGKGSIEQWQQAMDMHWTSNRKSIAEAIPPAYTEYIGNRVICV